MKVLHVFSIGTSLLRNYARRGGELASLVGRWASLPPDDEEQEAIELKSRRGVKVFEELLKFVDEDPRVASAELNAFYGLRPAPKPGDDGVVLFSTDTGVGWLCAKVLWAHLRGRRFEARRPIKLRGFGLGPDRFEEGLLSVVNEVVPVIRRARLRGLRVYVNATGGFKPEAAFLILASTIAGADKVYYVHEAFQDVVELPLLPLTVRRELIRPLLKLGGETPIYEAEKLLQLHGAMLQELKDRGLVEESEGFIKLKPWIRALIASTARGRAFTC